MLKTRIINPRKIIGAWRSLAARLLWEQEVGGSNPLAPTNDFSHLERIRVEPVLFYPFSRRWDRRHSLNFITLILLKIHHIVSRSVVPVSISLAYG